MEISVAQIVQIFPRNTIKDNIQKLLIDTPEGTQFVTTYQSFGLNMVGKEFYTESIPAFVALSIVQNKEGIFKLISIINTNSLDNHILTFKDNITGKLKMTYVNTLKIEQYLLGDYYDLSLFEEYSTLTPYPNIPINRRPGYVEVNVLQRLQTNVFLMQYGEKTFALVANKPDQSFYEDYIGNTILIQMFRRKHISFMFFKDINKYSTSIPIISNTNVIFQSSIKRININIASNSELSKNIGFKSRSKIFTYYSGASLEIKQLPTYVGINSTLKVSNSKNGYTLVAIYLGIKLKYVFVNERDENDIRMIYFQADINLKNSLGKNFMFDCYSFNIISSSVSIGVDVNSLEDNSYLLTNIVEEKIYVFEDNKKQIVFADPGLNTISPTKVGTKFNLTLLPISFATITDFTKNM
jgi:hypothetical protein